MDKIENICANCKKEFSKLLACSGCKEVKYCSQDCQKKHWKEHKQTCAYFKKKELEKLPLYKGIDWFILQENIGHGNYSEIWKARCKKDDKLYAIKVIQKQRIRQLNKEKDFFMEKHCLQQLSGSPYFIEFYGNFEDEQTMYMQLELVDAGELWNKSKIFGLISISKFKYYFAHIIQAVEEMHSKGIVHRDLKAENIMVTKENKIKLIDFGTAKDEFHPEITGAGQGGKKKKNYQHFVGTPNYMAPEQIRNKGSSYETDIFALAGVAYQLWGGFPAFNGGSEYLIFKEILNEDPVFPECLFAEQPQLQDLIMKMCKREMEDRIKIKDIKKHPFWNGFRWELLNEMKLSDLEQGQSKKEQFIQEIRDNFINNQQKYYEKDQLFVEDFNKYIIRYQQDPDFNQDQLLKQRLKIMKAQGRLLVDPENCVFNWKDHVQNTVTIEKQQEQQQQQQNQNVEDEKQQNSQDDSSSSDTDQDEKEQQKNKQNNNQKIEESQKDEQQQQKDDIQQIQETQ